MTLDLLDAAFVRRWETKPRNFVPTDVRTPHHDVHREQADDVVAPELHAAATMPVQRDAPVSAALPADSTPPSPAGIPAFVEAEFTAGDPSGDGIVPRLLAAARSQWQSLADRLEAARLRGQRVIAVAGGTAGEGRSTLVDCLVATLRSRGRDVLRLDAADVAARVGRGPTHDKRIVLVDAGIWFPPGPIRRPRLLAVTQGCDAAVLVRRADTAAVTAWEAALAAIGIEVLGEVLTFASAGHDTGGDASTCMGPI